MSNVSKEDLKRLVADNDRLRKENETYRRHLEEIHAKYCSHEIETFTGQLDYSECFGALHSKRALEEINSECFEEKSYKAALDRLLVEHVSESDK